MTELIQMTTEQLKLLIESVRNTPAAGGGAAETTSTFKSKGSFSNCPSRFGGQRNREVVEEFITSIVTYKEVEMISDDDALKGISLLFHGLASTWWQGVRKEVKCWNDVLSLIRDHFSPAKLCYQIYMEISDKKQDSNCAIDTFVCQVRAMLAQFPDDKHNEETELDLIYGLLNIKYRRHIARNDIKTFRDLLEKGRVIEHNLAETTVVQDWSQPPRNKRPRLATNVPRNNRVQGHNSGTRFQRPQPPQLHRPPPNQPTN